MPGNFLAARYGEINLLLLISYVIWQGLKKISLQMLPSSQLLKLNHIILFFVVVAPFLTTFLPARTFNLPSIQLGAELSAARQFTGLMTQQIMPKLIPALNSSKIDPIFLSLLFAFWAIGVLVSLGRFAYGIKKVRRLVRNSQALRGVGTVKILVQEQTPIPFSFYFFQTAYVVLPYSILGNSEQVKLIVLHELQHHRQGDTVWIYFMQAMKCLLFWNPVIYLWENQLSVLQEFACDENLIGHKNISPQAYCRCLIQVAEQSLETHRLWVATTGMALGTSGKTLKRRIDIMFNFHSLHPRKTTALVTGALSLLLLGTVAYTSQNISEPRAITLKEGESLAASLSTNSPHGGNFPVVVNQAVVDQLNRLIGTSEGRTFIKDSLARMQNYRPAIEKKLAAYNLPIELLAIPMVESGYQNMTRGIGAGIWMFIESTARHYNLKVNDTIDERLSVELETDAAVRYLSANFLRFQDWPLATLSYNSGERQVQKMMDRTGSRDAWKLIGAGLEGDKNYLAIVMATMLILKNPSLLT
jgi:membrane-bound lytic murein transglycosylase D